MATQYRPTPTAMPIAAIIQMPAAVVRPRTEPFICMMAPAPRKPIPDTTWAAMRLGSPFLRPRYSCGTYIDSTIARQAPMQMSEKVRTPAVWPLRLRSKPTRAPRSMARVSLYTVEKVVISAEFTAIQASCHI